MIIDVSNSPSIFRYVLNPKSQGRVASAVESFMDRENANTARAYRTALEDYRRFVRAPNIVAAINRLTEGDVAIAEERLIRYKRSLVGQRDIRGNVIKGRGLSPSAVNLRLTVLRSLLRKLHRLHLVDGQPHIPGIRSEPVNDVRGPGEEVLNRMLDLAKARTGSTGRRDYAILRLAGELGLRRREIVNLDVSDLDLDRCEIRILGKGRREKETLRCTQKTAEALRSWIACRPAPRDKSALFTNLILGRSNRISASAVYQIVRELGKEALPKRSKQRVSPHRIRHTAITTAVREARGAGLAREEVRKYSRHSDLRMLGRYIDADEQAQAILSKSVGDRLN